MGLRITGNKQAPMERPQKMTVPITDTAAFLTGNGSVPQQNNFVQPVAKNAPLKPSVAAQSISRPIDTIAKPEVAPEVNREPAGDAGMTKSFDTVSQDYYNPLKEDTETQINALFDAKKQDTEGLDYYSFMGPIEKYREEAKQGYSASLDDINKNRQDRTLGALLGGMIGGAGGGSLSTAGAESASSGIKEATDYYDKQYPAMMTARNKFLGDSAIEAEKQMMGKFLPTPTTKPYLAVDENGRAVKKLAITGPGNQYFDSSPSRKNVTNQVEYYDKIGKNVDDVINSASDVMTGRGSIQTDPTTGMPYTTTGGFRKDLKTMTNRNEAQIAQFGKAIETVKSTHPEAVALRNSLGRTLGLDATGKVMANKLTASNIVSTALDLANLQEQNQLKGNIFPEFLRKAGINPDALNSGQGTLQDRIRNAFSTLKSGTMAPEQIAEASNFLSQIASQADREIEGSTNAYFRANARKGGLLRPEDEDEARGAFGLGPTAKKYRDTVGRGAIKAQQELDKKRAPKAGVRVNGDRSAKPNSALDAIKARLQGRK